MAPGTEIGGYRVLGPLGRGGMGAVYRAVDADGTTVALKLLHPHLGEDPAARERLQREVRTLQRVRHPGVARVLDAEIEAGEAFVVTELVDGEDLGTRVRTRGALTPVELADLAERLRGAVAVVHETGVLHRDLTPGNVMVTERGPVLIDFGIAQDADDLRVTSTGLVMGTPGFVAPEVLEGGEPSEAGDWWSWAALLVLAATGRPPFGGPPLQAVLARARAGEPDLEGLDRRTATALRAALAVDPWRRPAPEHVVAELRLAAQGETEPDAGPEGDDDVTRAVPPPPPPPRDGGTRVLDAGVPATALLATGAAAGPAGADAADPGADDAWDDDGTDAWDDDADPDADLDGDDDAGDGGVLDEETGDAAPLPEPRRRTGTVLALGSVLVALGATRPAVALLVAVGVAVLVRSVGLDVTALHRRRARRGAGRADAARAVGAWPWYLVRSVLGVVPAAVVAASVVVVVGGVGWWLLDTGRWVAVDRAPGEPAGLGQNPAWVTTALLALAVLAGLLMLWFGPLCRATRVGARWTLATVAPGWPGALTASVLGLAAAAVLAVLALTGADVVWWPLPGPPDLG